MSRIRATLLLLSLLGALPAHAASCLDGFRAALKPPGTLELRVRDAFELARNRKGRAQAERVEAILKEHEDPASLPAWEASVLDRMTDANSKHYPALEELLALMAAKSPTFHLSLGELLTQHASMRFRVLAHFMEDVTTAGRDPWDRGLSVAKGRSFWDLWRTTVRLPKPAIWTSDDLSLFMAEISDAMFRVSNPAPAFTGAWLRSFVDVRIDPSTWNVWRGFSRRLLDDYRARYRATLEGVAAEAYGTPRPEVIAKFYRWGLKDTIFRRLTAILSKKGAGRQAAYDEEVERLAVDVMFFARPVLGAMSFYTWVLRPLLKLRTEIAQLKAAGAEIRCHPEKYLKGGRGQADADRLASLAEQEDGLTAERHDLEDDLSHNSYATNERAQRTRALELIDRRLGKVRELRGQLAGGIAPAPDCAAAN